MASEFDVRHSRAGRNVLEDQAARVPEELRGGEPGVSHEDVEVAVPVVVEEGSAMGGGDASDVAGDCGDINDGANVRALIDVVAIDLVRLRRRAPTVAAKDVLVAVIV